jgi:serine/threonine-protein kinase
MYMAPEQCRGLGEIDGRADVYALGCMLYELACGHPPFVRGGVGVIIGSHMYEPVPRPRALVPELPEALEVILLRALAKDPAARYQTMHELSQDLAQLGALDERTRRASL